MSTSASCSLPDIAGFATMSQAKWQAMGAQLRVAGLNVNYLEDRLRADASSWEVTLQRSLQIWHCRQRNDALSIARRLFMLRDPVLWDEAVLLLGADVLGALLHAGVVRVCPQGRVVSAFDLRVYRGLLLLCDDLSHEGNAVFGAGPGTAAFVMPARLDTAYRSALDLGCGAGAVALWLAGHVPRVVAADINPRALAFVEVNAAINGIVNVEVREGDLFDAVGGERYDLIMSQPPYVPHAPGAAFSTYLHGGPQGDEILMRLLRGLPRHLTDSARALLVFDLPLGIDAVAIDPRRAWQFEMPMRTLLLQGAAVDADAYCLRQAAPALQRGMQAFETAVTRLREHLQRLGVSSVCPALCVVEPAKASAGWSDVLHAGMGLWNEVSSETIDRLFAGRDQMHNLAKADELPRVRIPEGSLVIRRFSTHDDAAGPVCLVPPAGHLIKSIELDVQQWADLQSLHAGQRPESTLEIIALAAQAGLIDD